MHWLIFGALRASFRSHNPRCNMLKLFINLYKAPIKCTCHSLNSLQYAKYRYPQGNEMVCQNYEMKFNFLRSKIHPTDKHLHQNTDLVKAASKVQRYVNCNPDWCPSFTTRRCGITPHCTLGTNLVNSYGELAGSAEKKTLANVFFYMLATMYQYIHGNGRSLCNIYW